MQTTVFLYGNDVYALDIIADLGNRPLRNPPDFRMLPTVANQRHIVHTVLQELDSCNTFLITLAHTQPVQKAIVEIVEDGGTIKNFAHLHIDCTGLRPAEIADHLLSFVK